MYYNFPTTKFLNARFDNEAQFNETLNELKLKIEDIDLIMNSLKLGLFNYKLFQGGNVGFNLFNCFDD
jgi:hypothetical protein